MFFFPSQYLPEVVSKSDIKSGHFFRFVQQDVVHGISLLQRSAINPQEGQYTFLRMVNDLEGHGAKVGGCVVRQEVVTNFSG